VRQPAHVWKRFWSLKRGEHLFIGKKLLVKHNAIVADRVGLGGSVYVAPWRRVRTTELVSHRVPRRVNSPVVISAHPEGGPGPTGPGADWQLGNIFGPTGSVGPCCGCPNPVDGRTHFVGDDCPGGHHAENQNQTEGPPSDGSSIKEMELNDAR
jgi:hypothetical protein